MALLTVAQLRSSGGHDLSANIIMKMASTLSSPSATQTFDVFLSHRKMDAAIIYGLKERLSEAGFTSYVYWLDKSEYDIDSVTPEIAAKLRVQMTHCHCLLYAATANSSDSKWMPWELGFMDGLKHRSAIVPIVTDDDDLSALRGQEYLGIYPYIDVTDTTFWVNYSIGKYKSLRTWLNDPSEP